MSPSKPNPVTNSIERRGRRDFSLRLVAAAIVAGAGLGSRPSRAQESSAAYPSRPLRMVVPFPAGGPNDIAGRTVALKLTEYLKQPVVVDNRGGAGGLIGAELAVKAPADGYNLFVCTIHHAVLPALRPNLGYDIERDFAPISYGATFPIVLVVHPSLPVRSVSELIAYEKARPGSLSFASTGAGGGTHLAGELFNIRAGTKLLHVPYKGSAAAMTDLLGGQVQMFFCDAPTALPQIKSGRLRAIAVAGAQRTSLLPDLPTVAESGLPGYEAYTWAGFMVPRATPAPIVHRLSQEIARALADPAVKQQLADAGAEAKATSPEEFAGILHREMGKWGEVVRTAGIKPE
jgi:tripartite-type tricarboxylate transporter receptor subunit TctC